MTEEINTVEEQVNTKPKRTFNDFLLDLFDIVAFFLFVWWIVLFIRFFLFNPYTVVWQSMEPTFDEKDFIIVDKVTAKFKSYERWDIIVFVPEWKDVPYIKRVIWVPGDIVKIKDGWVYVCNKSSEWETCNELKEPYLPSWTQTKASCNISEFTVTEWSYFVLWDNRNHSTDSRCCFGLGCYEWSNYLISQKYIIWKVYVRIYPTFNKF